jgi:hypothetical protein
MISTSVQLKLCLNLYYFFRLRLKNLPVPPISNFGILDKSNGFNSLIFFMWTKVMVFILNDFIFINNFNLCLPCQAKRKQALLESNLSGIHLIYDKNVNQREPHRFPLIFLEYPMPLKTHL